MLRGECRNGDRRRGGYKPLLEAFMAHVQQRARCLIGVHLHYFDLSISIPFSLFCLQL